MAEADERFVNSLSTKNRSESTADYYLSTDTAYYR